MAVHHGGKVGDAARYQRGVLPSPQIAEQDASAIIEVGALKSLNCNNTMNDSFARGAPPIRV